MTNDTDRLSADEVTATQAIALISFALHERTNEGWWDPGWFRDTVTEKSALDALTKDT